jgi:hypothetical protein
MRNLLKYISGKSDTENNNDGYEPLGRTNDLECLLYVNGKLYISVPNMVSNYGDSDGGGYRDNYEKSFWHNNNWFYFSSETFEHIKKCGHDQETESYFFANPDSDTHFAFASTLIKDLEYVSVTIDKKGIIKTDIINDYGISKKRMKKMVGILFALILEGNATKLREIVEFYQG